jgi:hypothetical protein
MRREKSLPTNLRLAANRFFVQSSKFVSFTSGQPADQFPRTQARYGNSSRQTSKHMLLRHKLLSITGKKQTRLKTRRATKHFYIPISATNLDGQLICSNSYALFRFVSRRFIRASISTSPPSFDPTQSLGKSISDECRNATNIVKYPNELIWLVRSSLIRGYLSASILSSSCASGSFDFHILLNGTLRIGTIRDEVR